MKNILLFLTLVLLALGLLVIVDKFLGIFITIKNKSYPERAFLLPPNTEVIYKTPEFNIKVKTNTQGFRGRDYLQPKALNTVRILAIGDSFTYGWGVSLDDAWVDILEKELNNKIHDRKFEILNLGKSGAGPDEYLELVKKYIPIYNPDVIIVGVVEGDDFSQLIKWPQIEKKVTADTFRQNQELLDEFEKKNNTFVQKFLNFYLKKLTLVFPNINKILSQNIIIDTRQANLDGMRWYIKNLGNDELIKYKKIIPSHIQKMYLGGEINPVLFYLALYREENFVKVLDKNSQLSIDAYKKLSADLSEVYQFAHNNNVKTYIIDIPYGVFVSREYMKVAHEMGFAYIQDAWTSDTPMEVTKKAVDESGAFFIPSLPTFRKECSNDCFYKYDGHLTPKGNRLLASIIEKNIAKYIGN